MAGIRERAFPRFDHGRARARAATWPPVETARHEPIARLHMRLKPGPEAAGESRHALDPLGRAIPSDQLSELRLLVTELVTNSVRHGGGNGWIELEVGVYADSVRVAVTDPGPGFEPQIEPRMSGERPGGWGLLLVDRLADRWGVERERSTSVWFELGRKLADAA